VIPEGRGKSRTSGKKSRGDRSVGVLAKRSAEGSKRGVIAFRRKKKLILVEGYHGAMLITFRTAWSKCFAVEEPLMLTFEGFLASSWDEEDSRAHF
jgi:hypothetical protein